MEYRFELFIIQSNLEGDFNKRYYIRPLGSSVITYSVPSAVKGGNKIEITLAVVKLNIIYISRIVLVALIVVFKQVFVF